MQQMAVNNPPTMSSQPLNKHKLPPRRCSFTSPTMLQITPLLCYKLIPYYVTNYPPTPKTGEITPPVVANDPVGVDVSTWGVYCDNWGGG